MNDSGDRRRTADDDIDELAELLRRERPRAPAGFRERLRRALSGRASPKPRPLRLRSMISAYAVGGGVLLVLGALAASGAGPFGI